jgi:hypothetical protein
MHEGAAKEESGREERRGVNKTNKTGRVQTSMSESKQAMRVVSA